MKFESALGAMRDGARVARECWEHDTYWFLEENTVMTFVDVEDGVGRFTLATVLMPDLLADDWHIVPPEELDRQALLQRWDERFSKLEKRVSRLERHLKAR